MGLLGGKGTEDIPQAAEGLVDGAGLLLVLAFHLRSSQSLTAGVTCVSVSATRFIFSANRCDSSFSCSVMPSRANSYHMLLAILYLDKGMHAETSMKCCQQYQLSYSQQPPALQQHQLSFARKRKNHARTSTSGRAVACCSCLSRTESQVQRSAIQWPQ